jgi:hypothetical protein
MRGFWRWLRAVAVVVVAGSLSSAVSLAVSIVSTSKSLSKLLYDVVLRSASMSYVIVAGSGIDVTDRAAGTPKEVCFWAFANICAAGKSPSSPRIKNCLTKIEVRVLSLS